MLRRPRLVIALDAVQFLTEPARAAFLGHDPRPLRNGRRVADVLVVTAFEFGDPMAFVVRVESDNFSLHAGHCTGSPTSVTVLCLRGWVR